MWRKNSWYLGIIFIILLSSFVSGSSVRINEIYVEGNKEYEWVELYNYGDVSVNLTNWEFGDKKYNDTLQGNLILEPNKYALLTSDSTFVCFYWDIKGCSHIYVDGALGNGLGNNGDNIYIYDETGQVIDSLIYPALEGNVYALNETSNWNIIISGTPGYANFYTETCDPYIDILLDKLIFSEEEKVVYTPKVYGAINYEIEYWIEDLNNNIVRNKWTTSNSNAKQWTPNLNKNEQAFIIKANLTYSDCEDINLENNFKEKLIVVLEEEDFEVLDYNVLKINELFPNPQGSDNDPMPEGEWIELYNSGDESLDLENLGLKDNYGQDYDIFISDSNTIDGTIINPNDYLIIYMNSRSGFLNNDGFEKISLYKDDFLLDEVSYSGSTEGLTWGKIDKIWQLTLPTPGSINIYNESINESSLKIENLYDDTFKFGEIIRAKVHVYKGDTDRYSIQAWVEDEDDNEISKRSRVSIYNKFTSYDLIIPIQVFSNCREKYEEGEYDVIVEGLGLRDKEEIKLVSNVKDMCETIEKEVIKEVSTSITGLSEKDINADYSVEYTSKEVKERRLAIYFFCVILIIMLIYFGLSKNE